MPCSLVTVGPENAQKKFSAAPLAHAWGYKTDPVRGAFFVIVIDWRGTYQLEAGKVVPMVRIMADAERHTRIDLRHALAGEAKLVTPGEATRAVVPHLGDGEARSSAQAREQVPVVSGFLVCPSPIMQPGWHG